MKKAMKSICVIAVVALISVIGLALAACNNDQKPDVEIKYYADGAAVQAAIAAGQADYGVVGEPAATAFGNKFGYNIVMDLREEWNAATGLTGGYAMAATFVKVSLLENSPGFIADLLEKFESNKTFITENASAMTGILKAAGSTSTFPPASIPRCNIDVIAAMDAKPSVNKLLKIIFGKDMPDSLYYSAPADTTGAEGNSAIRLVAPDGAPALAIANLLSDNGRTIDGYTVNASIVTPAMIGSEMAKGTGDVIIMPVNAGANLIVNKNAAYKLVCVNTSGLLYMLGSGDAGAVSPADLKGSRIACIGQGAVPQYVLETILKNAGLTF